MTLQPIFIFHLYFLSSTRRKIESVDLYFEQIRVSCSTLFFIRSLREHLDWWKALETLLRESCETIKIVLCAQEFLNQKFQWMRLASYCLSIMYQVHRRSWISLSSLLYKRCVGIPNRIIPINIGIMCRKIFRSSPWLRSESSVGGSCGLEEFVGFEKLKFLLHRRKYWRAIIKNN